ncbi:cation-translocating P-type ATPase [Amycolatopsis alkalitolerans]|uniref:Cation-transporting P-type ATPase n=1 Tax=Amycolatopsis alkalitolerans TaxID=2547244 RepID=A0A5C4LT33_9PSEU|nr:cation-transporting P-type ATPase [Amycolatopsis alkalitolerans]TNC20070.1 cation-transporting P-type ATPase [Amycolatopsis alkalitolerans]
MTPSWHAVDARAALKSLAAGAEGLPEDERARRRATYGPNEIAGRHREPWWTELAESFAEPLQLLLIVVAVLSAVFGELSDAITIAAVVVVMAVLETVTELRAARAIDALKAMTAPTARLVTPQGVREVPAAGLVPGDVIAVGSGDVVPADARVLSARGIRVDESTLTGESVPVGKDDCPVAEDTELAARSSLLHAGTAVLAGEARALVVATGAATQLGELGTLVAGTKEPPTPLQRALSQLARAVLVAAIAASVLVPAVGLIAGQPWRDMLLAGLTLAFATVPEELPILITVLLAVGGRQLARRGALLRRLRAGETLGAVTAVVTDKTGTLTENRLRLIRVVGDRDQVLATALHTQAPDTACREPMEAQLAAAAHETGLAHRGEPVAAFPFDPTRKLVSRTWRTGTTRWAAVSGAPEEVLARCRLDDTERTRVRAEVDGLAADGLRVIAFARRDLDPGSLERETVERELDYVGLAVFDDPLREGVPDAVAALTRAGVATLVVTGDHADTATAVATRAGLPADVHTGVDLDRLTDSVLDPLLRHGTVIARATPATKHRVVQALQRRGDVVAVTGDGANDAPALAAADVGIALGRRGADLARAAADLVLTDDAYPTVVAAVAKGRNITAQLRRAVAFYLGAKLALVVVLLAALAAGLPTPFQPIHIVLLEIFMDLGASVAFVAEPAAPQAMRQPPRPPGSRFLDRATLAAIAVVTVTLTLAVLPAYLLTATGATDVADARTAAVLAWLAGHALIAWCLRTRPGLSWTANPAFPAWTATAIAVGALAAFTPLGDLVHLTTLAPVTAATVAGLLAVAVAAAIALRAGLHFARRL